MQRKNLGEETSLISKQSREDSRLKSSKRKSSTLILLETHLPLPIKSLLIVKMKNRKNKLLQWLNPSLNSLSNK
jgi:hypothetical protein